MLQPTSTEAATVLVIDDEPLVQRFLSHILAIAGYKVLEGHHADHALRLCRQYPDPIHLLITDIHMPDMNGRELAVQMRVLRPQIQVLYISSDENGLPETGFNSKKDSAFLLKPCSPDSLNSKVREVLGFSR